MPTIHHAPAWRNPSAREGHKCDLSCGIIPGDCPHADDQRHQAPAGQRRPMMLRPEVADAVRALLLDTLAEELPAALDVLLARRHRTSPAGGRA